VIDMLHRFGMMDYKSMATLMVMNLNMLHESTSGFNLVDMTMYR
jgi:hypothetical protein